MVENRVDVALALLHMLGIGVGAGKSTEELYENVNLKRRERFLKVQRRMIDLLKDS
jgi:hypothetical protein